MLVNRYVYSIADSMFIPLPVYEYRCRSARPLDTDERAGRMGVKELISKR